MADINSRSVISWEYFKENNIDFVSVLKASRHYKTLRECFPQIKSVSMVLRAFDALDILASNIFDKTTYGCGNVRVILDEQGTITYQDRWHREIKKHSAIYLGEASYSQLYWMRVFMYFFKKFYNDLYMAFVVKKPYDVNSCTIEEFIANDPKKIGKMTIKQFKTFTKQTAKHFVYDESNIAIYTDDLFFIKVNEVEDQSVYIRFSDLKKATTDPDGAWNDIVTRVWYMGKVQGEEEWFRGDAIAKLEEQIYKLKK